MLNIERYVRIKGLIMIKNMFSLLLLCISLFPAKAAMADFMQAAFKTDPSDTTYKNPVFQPLLADPTVVFDRASHTFYAYGTEDNWSDGYGPRVVPILSSKNLVTWKYSVSAFTKKPNWKAAGNIWAPDVNKVNGKYYLYYAFSTWGDADPGIGLAISDLPTGPFTDQGKVFSSLEVQVPNSIDPFYMEHRGQPYLFWGSFSSAQEQGTYAIALQADGRQVKDIRKKTKIAAGDFEAVIIHKKGRYYYFFGSKGSCCEGASSTYHVLVGRSKQLLGPYYDREGRDLRERGHGSLLLQGNDRFAGPGHNARLISDKKGVDWLLYHAIDKSQGRLANGTTRRVLMLDPIKWVDGWPEIKNTEPSSTDIAKPHF